MTSAERIARAENIVAAARKDPDLTTDQLAMRFRCSRAAASRALHEAGLKGAPPDGLGTILRNAHGFSAAVEKYNGKKRA